MLDGREKMSSFFDQTFLMGENIELNLRGREGVTIKAIFAINFVRLI